MARVPLLLSMSGAGLAGALGLGIGLAQASPALSACLAECKRPQLSATNRASCRLDCENEAASDPEQIRAQMERQTAPATPSSPAAGTRTSKAPLGCRASCDADRSLSVDDRASCKLDCEQEALPVPGRPAAPKVPGATASRVAPPAATSPTPSPSPTPTQAGFLARCQATCSPGFGPREAADFETCKLDCETMASVLDVAREWVPDAWLAAPTSTPAAAATTMPTAPIVARVAVTSPASTRSGGPPVATPSPSPVAQGCGPALERCNAGCSKQESACGRSCTGRSATDRETCKLTCGTDREVCQGDCLSASATCLNSQARR